MKFSTLVVLAAALVGQVSADCQFIAGNYYCNKATKIHYKGVGFSGSYNEVTSMNEDTGAATSQPKSFSGNMAPFDEDLSVHFRGPLKLSQFGVYYPASSSANAKRDAAPEEDCSTLKHVHHKHVKRATQYVTETMFVDQNGAAVASQAPGASPTTAVTPVPDYAPGAGSAPGAESAAAGPGSAASSEAAPADGSSSDSAPSSESSGSSSGSSSASSGDWVRSSYYTPGSASNCTFLNNFGGSGSGVWSSAFGNSLSYANSDNSGGSSSPVALGDVTIPSNSEFAIFSGEKCGDNSVNGNCGWYREGTVAYQGFAGTQKMFVFEFEMPSANGGTFNGDMPAIWFLNAKIPRTLQYGNADASCWKSGCGEFDVFEILSAGSDYLITTMHDGQGKGSSDYFPRPTSGSVKAVVIFDVDQIHVQFVDDSTDFSSVLDQSTVESWINTTGTIVSL